MSMRARHLLIRIALLAWPVLCLAQQEHEAANRAPDFEPCGILSTFPVRMPVVPNIQPTAIRVMPSRYEDLQQAQEGYRRTGLDLLAFNGKSYLPAGLGDDSGIYYYIPWLSRTFHVALGSSVSLFLVCAFVLSVALAACGFILVLRGWRSRTIGLIALCGLSLLAYRIGDVYLFEFALPAVAVPWLLHPVWQRATWWISGMCFGILGIAIGIAWTIRTTAAIPTCLFLVLILATYFRAPRRRKVLLAGWAVAGALLPILFLRAVAEPRNRFLVDRAGFQSENLVRHMMWHFAYIGLGFLNNPYVPGGVCDDVGKVKVKAINPQAAYLSQSYDQVLRREVMRVAEQSPTLVLFTLAAKLGLMLVVIGTFSNAGLLAAVFRPKPWGLDLAFWAAIAISIPPLLLFAPEPQYLVGLCSWAALYGVFSIEHALQPRAGTTTMTAEQAADFESVEAKLSFV